MRVNLPFVFALTLAFPAAAASQARIVSIVPDDVGIIVHRLGADRGTMAEVGIELMPGDMIRAREGDPDMELSCESSEGRVRYMLPSPFRVLIDVPTVASCHVNLLEGTTEVAANAPTETSAGGVTLGSSGTQYAVEWRRDANGLVLNCIVYHDTVRVLTANNLRAVGGSKLMWTSGRPARRATNTDADFSRSSLTYARFDLAASERAGMRVEDRTEALRQLRQLHYKVLANPADTASRVELAKEQIRYGIKDRAAFNLTTLNVITDVQLRRYEIDPAVVRGDLRQPVRPPVADRAAVDARRAAAAAAATTDTDLRLIAAGRTDEAVRNLEARVSAGTADSRDYYALARAWSQRGDAARMRANAGRALALHASDNRLSPAELRELGELISRLD